MLQGSLFGAFSVLNSETLDNTETLAEPRHGGDDTWCRFLTIL